MSDLKTQTVLHPTMSRGAVLSDCGRYRYVLDRCWNPILRQTTFVMLNPSIADANIDDPTIRRCIGFAKREGYGSMRVVNLFALRSPSPDKIKRAVDPIGPRNNAMLNSVLRLAAERRELVIAAWGIHGAHLERDKHVAAIAATHALTLHCLGKTQDGAPRHPLYVPADQTLEPWPAAQANSMAKEVADD